MSRRHRLSTFILLAVLVAIPPAAVLQWNLLDQASEAEAAGLRRVASAGARQIRSELAYGVGGLVSILASWDAESSSLDELEALLSAWESSARFRSLVKRVVVVRSADESFAYEPGSDGFEIITPGELSWVDSAAEFRRERGDGDLMIVAVPSYRVFRRDGGDFVEPRPEPPVRVLVQIDERALATTIIPTLVAEHFPAESSSFEAAAIDTRTGDVIYATVDVGADDLSLRRDGAEGRLVPDEIVPLVRLGLPRAGSAPFVEQWVALLEWTRLDEEDAPRAPDPPDDALVLAVWHPSGGIERAARIDRNRNLVLSYGFLAGVAGMALVFHVLYRRTQRQRAREQEFVATVTHELRTPIAAMYASAENLASGVVTGTERVREYGVSLLGAARRLRDLIDQTLHFAGLQSQRGPRGASTRLGDLVHEIADGRPDSRDSEFIRVDVSDEAADAAVDEVAIRIVISNLLSNAIKHNPSGTRIDLAADVVDGGGSRWVRLTVRDDGAGIRRRELRRVREAFFRGRRSQRAQVPGAGLGLSIVDRVVTKAGGKLDIDSVAGQGTTVTVRWRYDTT